MGGKRRGSSGGNIRKKRKSSKQTLARVAERKAASEAKLERRVKAAEQLTRHRETGAHLQLRNHADDKSIVVPLPEEEIEEERTVQQSARRAGAYETLVNGLEDTLFGINEKQGEKEGTKNGDVATIENDGARESEARRGMLKVQEVHISDKQVEQERASLEQENAAAAAREREHFGSAISDSETPSKLTAIATVDGVGRVSASLSSERKATLEKQLDKDLSELNGRSLGLQPSVYAKWQVKRTQLGRGDALSRVAQACSLPLREYRDLLLCRKLQRDEEADVRQLYVAHILAHIVRCRARVLRNDAALRKESDKIDAVRDQGFSRARALILLPMRNVAYDVVKLLMALAVGTEEGEKDVAHVANSERFETEFAPEPEEVDEDMDNEEGLDIAADKKPKSKPADFRHTFRGNIDDDFKLGIALTKKTMRLYSDFYESDIIVASPLGLRRTLAEKLSGDVPASRQKKGDDEDGEWKTGIGSAPEKPRTDDTDDGFLSSIEICVVDGAHVFSMQNFDSLRKAMEMLNKMPSVPRDTDFSRLREWCLDGLMKRYRQTVILSEYKKSEFLSLARCSCNHAGRVQMVEVPRGMGTMTHVVLNMRQTFYRVPEVTSPHEAPEKRIAMFFSKIFPMLRSFVDSQCLIFIPSYFDYVRVRNKMVKMAEEDPSIRFASMCEYSKGSDISRARARLFDRTVSFILFTERFHFYWRHWIRGANTVVWYGLPENAHFYPEILNMTAEAAEAGRPVQALALYDNFDSFNLERIVGDKRCSKMTAKNSRSTYLFM